MTNSAQWGRVGENGNMVLVKTDMKEAQETLENMTEIKKFNLFFRLLTLSCSTAANSHRWRPEPLVNWSVIQWEATF